MRGQTTLDFVIGISVFLGIIIFIFMFAPGILTPFTITGQSEAVTVDRTADYLSQDALSSPEHPYRMDRACLVAFFDRDADGTPSDDWADNCGYTNQPLNQQLGLAEHRTVNVTITGNVSSGQTANQLYWNKDERTLAEDSVGDVVELTIGDSVDQRRATTTATRVVTLHERDVIMTVVVS